MREIDLGYVPTNNFDFDGPGGFVMMFCYFRNGEQLLVKGNMRVMENYINNLQRPAFVHYVHYKDGEHWTCYGFYGFEKFSLSFSKNVEGRGYVKPGGRYIEPRVHNGYVFRVREGNPYSGELVYQKHFKRIPRTWIKEADQFLPKWVINSEG